MSYCESAMMSKTELSQTLAVLRVTQTEAAQLLGVAPRTVRRWLEGEDVPGPAEAALKAWRNLHVHNLAWRPDSQSIVEDDQDQIARHRNHAVDLAALLERVAARGGARTPWTVDVPSHTAKLGPLEVGFYVLQSGSFSLSTYTRRDRDLDLAGDWMLIEDAAACIAAKLAKLNHCADVLAAAADQARSMPPVFAVSGPRLMSAEERERRTARKNELADRLDQLATAARAGEASYRDFEAWNREWHALGLQLDNEIVSEIARSFVALDKTP